MTFWQCLIRSVFVQHSIERECGFYGQRSDNRRPYIAMWSSMNSFCISVYSRICCCLLHLASVYKNITSAASPASIADAGGVVGHQLDKEGHEHVYVAYVCLIHPLIMIVLVIVAQLLCSLLVLTIPTMAGRMHVLDPVLCWKSHKSRRDVDDYSRRPAFVAQLLPLAMFSVKA